MIEFPAGRFKVQVDVSDGRVGVTVVDNYDYSIRASVLPQIAADLGQAIQRAAGEATGRRPAAGGAEGDQPNASDLGGSDD